MRACECECLVRVCVCTCVCLCVIRYLCICLPVCAWCVCGSRGFVCVVCLCVRLCVAALAQGRSAGLRIWARAPAFITALRGPLVRVQSPPQHVLRWAGWGRGCRWRQSSDGQRCGQRAWCRALRPVTARGQTQAAVGKGRPGLPSGRRGPLV